MILRTAPKTLVAFVAGVLLWGVAAYAGWHASTEPLSIACGWMAARIVELTAPVDSARAEYRQDELVLSVVPDYESARRGGLPSEIGRASCRERV